MAACGCEWEAADTGPCFHWLRCLNGNNMFKMVTFAPGFHQQVDVGYHGLFLD